MKTQMTWLGLVLVSLFCLNAIAAAADGGTSVLSANRMNNSDKADQFGIGAQLGSFSGVSADFWVTHTRAYQAAIAFNGSNTAFSVAHDWFARGTFGGAAEAIIPYVGVGALTVFGDRDDHILERRRESFAFAIQVPVGLEYLPFAQRFGVFGELTPSLEVTPVAVGFLTADLGARFYF